MRVVHRAGAAVLISIAIFFVRGVQPAYSHHPGSDLFDSQFGEDDQLQRISFRFQQSAWDPADRGPVDPRNPDGVEELNGEFRLRVLDAMSQWNKMNRRLLFSSNGSDANFVDPSDPCNEDGDGKDNPDENSISVVDWGSLGNTGRLAGTFACPNPPQFGPRSRIEWFGIVFDDDASKENDPDGGWHTTAYSAGADEGGGFEKADSNEHDLWQAAAHEFGHVAGWWGGHYNQRRPDPDPDWQGEDSPFCGDDRPDGEESWHYFQTMCGGARYGMVRGRTLETHDIKAFKDIYAPADSVICSAIEQVNQACDADDPGTITP